MTSFNSGDLVAVKVEGYPFWPAQVTTAEYLGVEDPGDGSIPVLFLGTNEPGFAPNDPSMLIAFDENLEEWKEDETAGLKEAIEVAVSLRPDPNAEAAVGEEGGVESGESSADEEGDAAPAAGISAEDEAALAEKKRRKKEKKEKKRREKEKRKKEKEKKREKEKHSKRSEGSGIGHKKEKKKEKKTHDFGDYSDAEDDVDNAPVQRVAAVPKIQKTKVTDEELRNMTSDLQFSIDSIDVDGVRVSLTQLSQIDVSIQQLMETKVGIVVTSIFGFIEFVAAHTLAQAILRYWAKALPAVQRRYIRTCALNPAEAEMRRQQEEQQRQGEGEAGAELLAAA